MIFTKFCCFGSSEGSFCDFSSIAHAFKAKKVTFRDIVRVLRKKGAFWLQNMFSLIFCPGAKNRSWASKKTSQNLTFINSFARGARLGPENLKRAVLHPKTHFWGPGPPRGPASLKKHSISLGIPIILTCPKS